MTTKEEFLVLYDKEYGPLLADRTKTFRAVFEALSPNPSIVETGTLRTLGNWAGDGQSTILWDKYAQICGGWVWTVDIENRRELISSLVSSRTTIVTSDSILFFKASNAPPIDLLYLDSLDGNFPNTAEHMLAEFQGAQHLLRPGAIVLIDDISTKGRLIIPHIEGDLKWPVLTRGTTQIAWRSTSSRTSQADLTKRE
jgi:hypothetical protein